ncbi:MAG: dihydrodipicolinate synthase family protein [Anaerolineales bacterium]|nr:dihydrodipicolinate synthase family protein [Anaerolineales bacterium]
MASEGYKLDDAERDRVARIVLEQAGGRVPVVISADGNGTDIAVARARAAARLGASALMVLPPCSSNRTWKTSSATTRASPPPWTSTS